MKGAKKGKYSTLYGCLIDFGKPRPDRRKHYISLCRIKRCLHSIFNLENIHKPIINRKLFGNVSIELIYNGVYD